MIFCVSGKAAKHQGNKERKSIKTVPIFKLAQGPVRGIERQTDWATKKSLKKKN